MIIDELLTFFLAGMQTVQQSTCNSIIRMDMNPDIKKKVLDEILPAVEDAKENIVENLTYQTVMDFDYLHEFYYEVLRIEPPLELSVGAGVMQDVTLKNGVTICKGDMFLLGIYDMHHNPEHWIEPEKFVPERFNTKSPYYKRPNGEPRHPLVFNPFLGGKRMCIGKTFAEVVVRFTLPIIYYHLDFELSNPEHRINKPRLSAACLKTPSIMAKVFTKVKVE